MNSQFRALPDKLLSLMIEHRWRLLASLALLVLTLIIGQR